MRQSAGLRLRPVPELSVCLAYTPSPPRLHTLNPAAWLIVELCGGAPEGLEAAFVARACPPLSLQDAREQLQDGVRSLLAAGIIEEGDGT